MVVVRALLEAEVPGRGEDQVIEQPDAQQVGGVGQVDGVGGEEDATADSFASGVVRR